MPHIHDDDGDPSGKHILRIIVVDAHGVHDIAQQANVAAGENLPDGADHVPRHEQRQGHDDEAGSNAPTLLRHSKSHKYAERHLNGEDNAREHEIPAERVKEAAAKISGRVKQFREPADAVPEELVIAECVLNRVVHHRHQRQNGVKGHDDENGKDQEPGAIIDGFVHAQSLTRWPSA